MKPLKLQDNKWVIVSDPISVPSKAIEHGSIESPVTYRQIPAMFWGRSDTWSKVVVESTLIFNTEAEAKQCIDNATPSAS